MKESGINSPAKQFFHLRRKIWQTPEGDICVTLPKECMHAFGHPAEIDICGFPHALLLFPTDKRHKLKEVKHHILTAVSMIELREKMKDVMKDAEKAAKKLRKFTRSKRKR